MLILPADLLSPSISHFHFNLIPGSQKATSNWGSFGLPHFDYSNALGGENEDGTKCVPRQPNDVNNISSALSSALEINSFWPDVHFSVMQLCGYYFVNHFVSRILQTLDRFEKCIFPAEKPPSLKPIWFAGLSWSPDIVRLDCWLLIERFLALKPAKTREFVLVVMVDYSNCTLIIVIMCLYTTWG